MLCRVAERAYWLGRYIERVENLARLVKTHSQLMYDLPSSVSLSWSELIEVSGNTLYFESKYSVPNEESCCKALLVDSANPSSLLASLAAARENIRVTRDILPREAWIYINDLYLAVKDQQEAFCKRTSRTDLLNKVIQACQAWNGMFEGTMSRNQAYRFVKLGMALERADMTSRIVDDGVVIISRALNDGLDAHPYAGILWVNLLKSVSASFMYRQTLQTEISGEQVVKFLLSDADFSRSLMFNCQLMKTHMGEDVSPVLSDAMMQLSDKISAVTVDGAGSNELHTALDEIQLNLAELNNLFYDEWFDPIWNKQTA